MTSMGFDVFARDHASRTFDKVGDSAKDLEQRLGGVGKAGTKLKGDLDDSGQAASGFGSALSGLGDRLSGLGGRISGLAGQVSGLAGPFTAAGASMAGLGASVLTSATKVGAFAGAAASAASSLSGLIAALAPAAGAIAALPAGLALGAAAMVTLKIATAGVGEAFGAALTADFEKFAEVTAGLPQNVRTFAEELRTLKPSVDSLRITVQNSAFGPLTEDLATTGRLLIDVVQPGMNAVAGEFGRLGAAALQFGQSASAIRLVRGAFETLQRVLGDIQSSTMRGLLGSMAAFATSTLPAFDGLGAALDRSAQRFSLFLTTAAASGAALQWIENAKDVFKQLGAIAKDVGGILGAVFDAMKTAGGDALGVLGQLLDGFNTFLNSAEGQHVLVEVFKALSAAGAAFFPVLKAVAGVLGQLAPQVADLATAVGPVLTAAITALGPAVAAVGPGILAMIGGLAQAVGAIAPALLPLGQAIGQAFTNLKPLIAALGPAIAALLPGAQAFLTALSTGLAAVAPLLEPLGAELGNVLAELGGALGMIIPQIAKIAVALAPALTAALVALGPALASLGPGLTAVATMLAKAFASPEMQAGLLAIGKGLADLLIAAAPLLPIVAQLAGIIAQLLGAALTNLGSALGPIIIALGAALAPALRSISDALTILTPLMAPLYEAFGKIGATLITELLPPVLNLIPALLTGLVPAIAEMARQMQPLLPMLTELAIKFVREILPAILPMLPELTRLSLELTRLGLVVAKIVADFAPAIERGIQIFQRLFDVLIGHSIIPDLINGMTKWFRDGVQWVKDAIAWFGELPGQMAAWLGNLVDRVQAKWHEIKNAIAARVEEIKTSVSAKIDEVVGFFRDLPGRVIGGLGNLGSTLYNSGRSLIQGLIDGLYSMLQNAYNAASDILGRIRNLFPFSPAREGPFSGRGWTLFSGQSMADGLAKGLTAGQGAVARAADALMGAASLSLIPSVTARAGGGQTVIPLTPQGGGLTINLYFTGQPLVGRDEIYRMMISALNEAKLRGFNLGNLGGVTA